MYRSTIERLGRDLGDLLERHETARDLREFERYAEDPVGFFREVRITGSRRQGTKLYKLAYGRVHLPRYQGDTSPSRLSLPVPQSTKPHASKVCVLIDWLKGTRHIAWWNPQGQVARATHELP